MFRRRLAAWWLVTRLGLPYLILIKLGKWFPRFGSARLNKLHQRGATILYAYIVRQGGLLIKIGQYIASRPDIFPLAYVDIMASLRDAVPRARWLS